MGLQVAFPEVLIDLMSHLPMPATLPQLTNTPVTEIKTDWLVLAVAENGDDSPEFTAVDNALGGTLTRLRERKDLCGKSGETTLIPDCPGLGAKRLLVVGLGPIAKLTLARWEQALLTATRKASSLKETSICLTVPEAVLSQIGADKAIQTAAYAIVVGSFAQALYKAEQERFPFSEALIHTSNATSGDAAVERGVILGESVNLTRELVNRHPEDIYPETFARRAVEVANAAGVSTEVMDRARLENERMGSLLAVARGSVHDPRVIVFRYQGASESAPWIALCGKGVTFDSGGLSIKPSDSMITMKGDMAGAATVLGAITAIARLKLPVNVLGTIGLVENMIGPHSYKMGEVLTARNGKTIEVHNTDAEGRLVLADVLCYTAEEKPACIVDLATLTGSCVVALGMDIAGAFTNDQPLCDKVLSAAKQAGEELWQLPMHDIFNEQLKCDFADMKNVGTRWGGSITAAKFLEKFVDETPWVHLDIAGPAFAESAKPYRDIGGTGMPLRTLVEFAENYGHPK